MNPNNIYKSILLEIFAMSALIIQRNFLGAILFFIFHSIASLLVSKMILTLMPSTYKKKLHVNLLFMTILNTATLSLGYVASFYVAVVMLRKQKFEERYEISSINTFNLNFLPLVKRQLGEAAASTDFSYLAKETKLKIMEAFSSQIKPQTFRIIKKFLSDSDDEIRIYSFQILSKIKNDINEKINATFYELEKENDNYKKAILEKRLAVYYFDIFNLEISDEALMSFFIDKSMFHLSNAEKFMLDGELLFLKGQILFSKNKYDDALEAFEKAVKYGIDGNVIYPIIAEIHYIRNDYAKVREILKKDISLKLDFHTMPIAVIWEGPIAYN